MCRICGGTKPESNSSKLQQQTHPLQAYNSLIKPTWALLLIHQLVYFGDQCYTCWILKISCDHLWWIVIRNYNRIGLNLRNVFVLLSFLMTITIYLWQLWTACFMCHLGVRIGYYCCTNRNFGQFLNYLLSQLRYLVLQKEQLNKKLNIQYLPAIVNKNKHPREYSAYIYIYIYIYIYWQKIHMLVYVRGVIYYIYEVW